MVRTIELIKKLEGSKNSKKILINFKKGLKSENVERISIFVYSLPIMMQSRWEILNALKLESYESFVFDEILACSVDQDCASKCSSLVVGMAQSSSELISEKISAVVYSAMSSPCSSTRSNVTRSWISRMINDKSSEQTIYRILNLAKTDILHSDDSLKNVEYRELLGVTCVDLEWKPRLDQDPVSRQTLAFYAYFNVLLSTLGSGSQVRLEIDQTILELGIDHVDALVRLLSYRVVQGFKVFPQNLESSVLEDLASEDVLQAIYPIKHVISEDGQKMLLTAMEKLEDEKKNSSRFYPSENKADIKVSLETYQSTISSIDKLLKLQCDLEFPSVAEVMDNLKNKNIDERFYVEKVIEILDSSVNKEWKVEETSEVILRIMSRCPLRAVVDYGGEVLRKKCRENEELKEYSFVYAKNLLEKTEENSRTLFFEVALIATISENEEKTTQVWEIIKTLPLLKKQKMFEMFANVIGHTSISISRKSKRDILLCSIGIKDSTCTQLFEAIVSKMLSTRHETDRCFLFTQSDKIFELIQKITQIRINLDNKTSVHLALFFFTRFVIGSKKFFTDEQNAIIQKMSKFVSNCVTLFRDDPIMRSTALEAKCVNMSWSQMRKAAYKGQKAVFKYRHHWEMLYNVVKKVDHVKESDLLKLPGPAKVAANFENDSCNLSNIRLDTFYHKHSAAFFAAKTAKSALSESRKLDLIRLCWRIIEKVENDEFVDEYKMVFSWISRACCYLQLIDSPKRVGILKEKIANRL